MFNILGQQNYLHCPPVGKRLCRGCITVYWGCISVYIVHSDNLVCYRRRTTVAGTARSPSPSTLAAPTTRRRRPRSWSDSPSGKYYYAQFNQSSTRIPSAPSDWFLLRRMINTKEKAEVVTAAWGTELIQFLAAVAIFQPDDLFKRMNRITTTWRNGCYEKMVDHLVHTTPSHHPTKMDVLPKSFLQIILAAKWLVRHSSTSLD